MISKKVFISTIVLIFVGFLFLGAVTRFYALKLTPQSGDTYGFRVYDATGTTNLFGVDKSGNIENYGYSAYQLTSGGTLGFVLTAALMRSYSLFLVDPATSGVSWYTDDCVVCPGKSGVTIALPTVESDMNNRLYTFVNTTGTTRMVLYGVSVGSASGTTQASALADYSGNTTTNIGSILQVIARYNSGVSWIVVKGQGYI